MSELDVEDVIERIRKAKDKLFLSKDELDCLVNRIRELETDLIACGDA